MTFKLKAILIMAPLIVWLSLSKFSLPRLNKELCLVGKMDSYQMHLLLDQMISYLNQGGIKAKKGCGFFSIKIFSIKGSYLNLLLLDLDKNYRLYGFAIPFAIPTPSLSIKSKFDLDEKFVYRGFVPFLHPFGQNIILNEDVVSKLKNKELQLLFLHEYGHILGLGHRSSLEGISIMNTKFSNYRFLSLERVVEELAFLSDGSQIAIGY